ncbi:MFS transporter [Natronorubrum sp. JWXQ-INN-674]|uniref:MFS transporter n=1 Tax=Natronorubrum halalkaliphilum TaxID=2691917 RepID=A0A6B0VRZ5_9EURY|nr:MFS transporter [Natronorubrum halalkaliphilum]
MFSMALPGFIEETTVSYTGISFLFGALFVGYGVSQYPAGSLADVLGTRIVLVGGILTATLSLVSLYVASYYGHVFGAVFLVGVGIGSYRSASQIAASAIASERTEGTVLGILTAANPFGYVVGPVVIGALIETYGLYTTPLMLAFVPLPLAVLLWYSSERSSRTDERDHETPSLRRGLVAFKRNSLQKRTLLVVAFGVAFTTTSNSLIAILPLYLLETTSLTLTTGGLYAGGIFGIGTVAALLGGIYRDRIGAIPVLLAGFTTAAVSLSLLVFVSSVRYVLVLLCLFSLGLNAILPVRDFVINTHAKHCSPAYVGGMIGGMRSLCYLGGGIGASVVGVVFGRFGFVMGFGLLVALLIAGALCTVLLWYTDRQNAEAGHPVTG